jgi:hypothetical protein
MHRERERERDMRIRGNGGEIVDGQGDLGWTERCTLRGEGEVVWAGKRYLCRGPDVILVELLGEFRPLLFVDVRDALSISIHQCLFEVTTVGGVGDGGGRDREYQIVGQSVPPPHSTWKQNSRGTKDTPIQRARFHTRKEETRPSVEHGRE